MRTRPFPGRADSTCFERVTVRSAQCRAPRELSVLAETKGLWPCGYSRSLRKSGAPSHPYVVHPWFSSHAASMSTCPHFGHSATRVPGTSVSML